MSNSIAAAEQRKAIGQAVKARSRSFRSEAAKTKPRVLRMKADMALDAAWDASWGCLGGYEELRLATDEFSAGLGIDLNDQGRAFEILLAAGDLRGAGLAWSKTPIESVWAPSKRQGFIGQAWSASMASMEAFGLPCPIGSKKASEMFSSQSLGWAMRCCLESDLDDAHLEALSWEARLMSGESMALPFDTARERVERLDRARGEILSFNAKLEAKSIDSALWSRVASPSKPRSRL